MGAHSYYRIRYRFADTDNTQYAEVFFKDASGTDLCTGGTVIKSSQYDSGFPYFAAANAFDRNNASGYAASGNAGEWIGYAFASPVEVAKVGVTGSASFPTLNSKGLLFEYSDDGSTWTTEQIFYDTLGNLTAGGYREYTVTPDNLYGGFDSDPHRYWRLRIVIAAKNDPYNYIWKLDFQNASGTSLVTGGETFADSGHYSTYTAANCFGGAGFVSNGSPVEYWLSCDFGSAKLVEQVELTSWNGFTNRMPLAWVLEYSDDNATWIVRSLKFDFALWSGFEERSYTFDPPAPTDITKDVDFDYKIRLFKESTFDYKIRLGKSVAFDYQINAIVSKSVTFDYKIKMIKAFDFDYKIKAFADFDFDYQVVRTFQSNFQFNYKINVYRDRQFDYKIKVFADFDFDYEVIKTFGRSFTFDYKVKLFKLKTFDYRIKLHKNFSFDYEIINSLIPVTGPYVWRLPEVPITEIWEYKTKISTMRSGLEQRANLRKRPRVTFQHRHIILTDDDFRTFQNELLTQLVDDIRVPQHSQTVAVKSPTEYGDTTVYCKMEATDIRVGEVVAFFDIGTEDAFLRLVSGVSTNSFTISEPYPFSDHRGVAVTPTRLMRFADGSANKMRTVWGNNDLTFTDATSRDLVRPSADTDLVAEFDGFPIITQRPLANDDISDSYNAGFETIDLSQRLPPEIVRNWRGVAVTRSYAWSFRRGVTLDYWRELADKTRGSWRVFLMPTFRPDLKAVSSAGALVTVAGNMLESVLILGGYKHLMITTTSGVSFYRIDGVALAGDSTALTLSGSVSGTIKEISFVNLVRISDDVFTFSHNDMFSELTLNLRVVHQ